MYVIDILRSVNPIITVNEMTKVSWFFDDVNWNNTLTNTEKEELKEKVKNRYINELLKISKTSDESIIYNDTKILFPSKRIGSEELFYDCSLIDLNEKDKILENIKLKNFEDVFEFKNPLYGILFTKRNEILGYRISNKTLGKMSKEKFAAAILYSLTSFAIDEKEREEKQEEIIASLEKQELEIESKTEKTYSEEDIFKELGVTDERTNIEKLRERYSSLCETYKDIINLIFDIQEILIEENIITDDFNE